jgi:hypothetical protein
LASSRSSKIDRFYQQPAGEVGGFGDSTDDSRHG